MEAMSDALQGPGMGERGLGSLIDRARPAEAPVRSPAPPPDPAPTYRAADLLAGSSVARIVLGDRRHTPRLPRAGKLIPTR